MPKPSYFILLATLLITGGKNLDGGVAQAPSAPPTLDAGTFSIPPGSPGLDAGMAFLPSSHLASDAGAAAPPNNTAEAIHWPEELHPLATLDGPAVLAANAALQRVLARFPKEYAKSCAYSAKAMEVVVGQDAGLYFVRIDRRVDKCGWRTFGLNVDFDWFELYAVSPDGQVLARYPYSP